MADDAETWRGRVIDERYEVDGILGKGGMGVVLRAHHKFTGAAVAIKVLRPELAQDAELQRRFLGEARASNTIGHPGIIHIFDAGRDASGELYLAMELLEGESLRPPIIRGQITAVEAQRIGVELLAALGAAHDHGFVHRDLKPENVFLVAPHGIVKLLDFGIAKVIAAKPSTVGATAAGVLLGTVAYMAPEQLEDARGVDARSDLWAVGVMLYELFTGRLPFDAYTPQALFVAVATAEPVSIRVPLPSAPPALEAFFARALARDPAKRFASAAEMSAALGALQPLEGPIAAGRIAVAARPVGAMPASFAPPHPAVLHSPAGPNPAMAAPPRATSGLIAGDASPPPKVETATTKNRGPLWLGLASAVALAGVAVAYVVTRPPARGATSGDAATQVARVASPAPITPTPLPLTVAAPGSPPPIDAASPPIDAAPPPIDAPPPPIDAPPPPVPPADAAVAPPSDGAVGPHRPRADASVVIATGSVGASAECSTACEALKTCELLVSRAHCERSCSDAPAFAACVNAAPGNCTTAATCNFTNACGAPPSGATSCRDTLLCLAGCGLNDIACSCVCNRAARPGMAWMLGQVETCAVGCANNEACMDKVCPAWRACQSH